MKYFSFMLNDNSNIKLIKITASFEQHKFCKRSYILNLLRELNSIIQLLLNYFYTKISSLDFIKKEENWYGKIWPSLCCSNEIDRTSTKEMLNISSEVDNISKLEHP